VSRVPLGRRILGVLWVLAGSLHFARPKIYEAIMPDWLPAHRELVLLSGAAEITGGLAVFHPSTRLFGRWWLIATLVGIFPANVNMAQHPERYRKIPVWALWLRLPLQGLMVLGVWRGTAAE
jgi:uncharacterized membrane protein